VGTGPEAARPARALAAASGRAPRGAVRRRLDDGVAIAASGYMVGDAVRDWLAFELAGRSASTVANYTATAENHIIAPGRAPAA